MPSTGQQCNFTLNAASRASGLAQITRVPDSNIKFVSCGIYLDSNIVNSTTCFQACRPLLSCMSLCPHAPAPPHDTASAAIVRAG